MRCVSVTAKADRRLFGEAAPAGVFYRGLLQVSFMRLGGLSVASRFVASNHHNRHGGHR